MYIYIYAYVYIYIYMSAKKIWLPEFALMMMMQGSVPRASGRDMLPSMVPRPYRYEMRPQEAPIPRAKLISKKEKHSIFGLPIQVMSI
jgi:hypothetical protein